MSMIRSGIGTPEAFRHHALAQRVAGGLNARDHILGPLQLEGEIFSLDIPSHRTPGWSDFFGSPNDLERPPDS
jgi:hypothetical protein